MKDIAIQEALAQARAELQEKLGTVVVCADVKNTYTVTWAAASSEGDQRKHAQVSAWEISSHNRGGGGGGRQEAVPPLQAVSCENGDTLETNDIIDVATDENNLT